MAGNIHRQKKNRDFVTIDTHCLRNKDLRWDAKGLHSYLMQLPDDWKINVADLEKRSLDRHDGTMSPMRALIAAGYVYRERISGEKGRFVGYDYHLFERPEQTIEWLTVNGKSIDGKTVNGKSTTSKVLKPLSDVSKNEGEGERNTPAPNPSNLKEEKKENGLVAPAENPETVKAEKNESPKVAAKGSLNTEETKAFAFAIKEGVIGFDGESEDEDAFAQWLPSLHTAMENNAPGSMPIPAQFEVTAIASPTDLPGVTLVEAALKLQPPPRAQTTIEAEQMIATWIKGEGEQTVKARFNVAKQRFDPLKADELALHYCSVYTKNAANKGRLLADPITHFSDGLFSYLKNEESWGRNNAPKEGSPTRGFQAQKNGKANLNHWGANPGGYEEKQAF